MQQSKLKTDHKDSGCALANLKNEYFGAQVAVDKALGYGPQRPIPAWQFLNLENYH